MLVTSAPPRPHPPDQQSDACDRYPDAHRVAAAHRTAALTGLTRSIVCAVAVLLAAPPFGWAEGFERRKDDPLELTAGMRIWARREVNRAGDPMLRLVALWRGLVDQNKLGIRPERGYTATARQAFERRRANCTAFALLFASLGRDLGVTVDFALVGRTVRYRDAMGFRVAERHLGVVHEMDGEVWMFGSGADLDSGSANRGPDLRSHSPGRLPFEPRRGAAAVGCGGCRSRAAPRLGARSDPGYRMGQPRGGASGGAAPRRGRGGVSPRDRDRAELIDGVAEPGDAVAAPACRLSARGVWPSPRANARMPLGLAFLPRDNPTRSQEDWRFDYNGVRPHGSLGRIPPVEFAAQIVALRAPTAPSEPQSQDVQKAPGLTLGVDENGGQVGGAGRRETRWAARGPQDESVRPTDGG